MKKISAIRLPRTGVSSTVTFSDGAKLTITHNYINSTRGNIEVSDNLGPLLRYRYGVGKDIQGRTVKEAWDKVKNELQNRMWKKWEGD